MFYLHCHLWPAGFMGGLAPLAPDKLRPWVKAYIGVRCYGAAVQLHDVNEILHRVVQILVKPPNVTSGMFFS